ncbi:asparaginase domain-containing protein [Microbacterium sp. LRZ72]|uniref:asparaginase domain-containing protein n=1 Tax=Microbacterium sp. LRZ72 TaxID=2942481 RepID=UPI0029A411A2|nr:asparaginase domain-containing protein [Microbacterium sp. LRZ72]MDX2376749.1 asparaginase domain-containing protein [Microbacterium sp. LRZ72]
MASDAPALSPMPTDQLPRVVVFSGANATVQNSEPLVTSDLARRKYGLRPRRNPDGTAPRHDIVRPQRLAAPVTVYVEAYSAHPLEPDAADLYAPPDGYLTAAGEFTTERTGTADVPVYEVTIGPEDGLFALPYMARTREGTAWEQEGIEPLSAAAESRQTFYPDASRIFEEIDRFGLDHRGQNNMLASKARYDFVRAAPSGGYVNGLPSERRTDAGEGDIPPEQRGEDFFGYRPYHLAHAPAMATLARLTNTVQSTLDAGDHDAAMWLEDSANIEETAYWLNLLIDTRVPVACVASQRPHGALSNDGDRNLVDGVAYIRSRIWSDADGADAVGVVLVQDEQIFAARDAQKADARPGGFTATGGHGGIVGTIGAPGDPMLTYRPVKRHTHRSAVNLRELPATASGVRGSAEGAAEVEVKVKDDEGLLVESAIPKVTFVKYARYGMDDFSDSAAMQVEIRARVEKNLATFPLAGFVLEGMAPFGIGNESETAALRHAVLRGMPVVCVTRGNAEGMVGGGPGPEFVKGSNLTATKARLLLMACLLRFGSLPPAADPAAPTPAEWDAIHARVAEYQWVFDTH